MKHKLLLMLAVLSLTSCKSLQPFYEICEVNSDLTKDSYGAYTYKDNVCEITYNLWSNGGDPGFTFTNNSDEVVYIDLSNSFFIINGYANDYFLNRTTSSSSSSSESVSASVGGKILGHWNTITGPALGSLSASTGKNSTASKSNAVSINEKRIIAIPPHSTKSISEYVISSSEISQCEYNITPKKKEPASYSFDAKRTPVSFGNYITYSVGSSSDIVCVKNDFYISKITFLNMDDALMEVKNNCNNSPNKGEKTKVVKDSSPSKFYIRYFRETSSSLSSNKNNDW